MMKLFSIFVASLRVVLLMMIVVCLNGCILLEQPISSFFEYFPRWRELVCMLQEFGGPDAVTCLSHPKALVCENMCFFVGGDATLIETAKVQFP